MKAKELQPEDIVTEKEKGQRPMRATLQDKAIIKSHGYSVQKERFSNAPDGWTLLSPDGGYLMIQGYGCVSPTEWQAVAEALKRIERDQ